MTTREPGGLVPCSASMNACKASCLHRERVRDYQRARDDQWARCEAVTTYRGDDLGRPEVRAFYGLPDAPAADHTETRVLFKTWLQHTRNLTRQEKKDVA